MHLKTKGSRRYSAKRVAFHEAGHAVAAILVREKLREATIVPNEEYFGHCKHYRNDDYHPDSGYDQATTLITRKRVFTLVAGYVAEALARRLEKGNRSKVSGEQRLDVKLPKMIAMPFFAGNDFEKAMNISTYLFGDAQTSLAFVQYMWFFAGESLRFYWDFVRVVAFELLDKRTLSRKKIVALMRQSSSGETLPEIDLI